MSDSEKALKAAEDKLSAQQFISTIAPMTAGSGQIEILRRVGGITRQDDVLEVWCGAGDLTVQLCETARQVTGADHSERLIHAARERYPDIEFVLSETINLPFPQERFDVVVSNYVAHHYTSPEKNFSEIHRVLKPGGRIVVTIPIQEKRTSFNIILDTARTFVDLPKEIIKGGPLINTKDPDQIINTLYSARFQQCEGGVCVNHMMVSNVDAILSYAWNKIGLHELPAETQDRIRNRSIDRMQDYRLDDGTYRFPEEVLAVRGVK